MQGMHEQISSPWRKKNSITKHFKGELFSYTDKKINLEQTNTSKIELIDLAPVVQTLDSAIHRINHYPADSFIDFRNTCPLDSDLSGG